MKTNLRFSAAEVLLLIEHAKTCDRHLMTCGERWRMFHTFKHVEGEERRGAAALWLVKDEGIYLMSNGDPRLPDPAKPGASIVVYAEGFDPNKEDQLIVWERAREAVGGDDFAERVPLDGLERLRAGDTLVIEMMRGQFEVGIVSGKRGREKRKSA